MGAFSISAFFVGTGVRIMGALTRHQKVKMPQGGRIGSLLAALVICGFAGHAQAADDWQYWNGMKLTHGLHEQWDVQIKVEQRVTGDLDELGLHNYAPGIVYKPNTHVQYAVGYKYELSKGASRWSEEHRLQQMLTLKGVWRRFKGSVGTRFEYRSID